MNTKLFQGFYLKIEDRKLKCYGLGLIRYSNKFKPVFIFSNIDTCVKEISKSDDYDYNNDVGILDSQDMENSFEVYISTYMSIFILSCIGYGGYYITKKLIK